MGCSGWAYGAAAQRMLGGPWRLEHFVRHRDGGIRIGTISEPVRQKTRTAYSQEAGERWQKRMRGAEALKQHSFRQQ